MFSQFSKLVDFAADVSISPCLLKPQFQNTCRVPISGAPIIFILKFFFFCIISGFRKLFIGKRNVNPYIAIVADAAEYGFLKSRIRQHRRGFAGGFYKAAKAFFVPRACLHADSRRVFLIIDLPTFFSV